LQDIVVRVSEISVSDESKGIMQRYGMGGMLRIITRTLRLYTRSSNYRQFVKEVRQDGITPENITEYFGYGMYVGRKAEN
jgi:hypothetical protein